MTHNKYSLRNYSATTLQQLKSEYSNPHVDNIDRDHSYFAYWKMLLQHQGYLSHQDIMELISKTEFHDAIGSIIKEICVEDCLDNSEIQWLAKNLPQASFAHNQILALEIARQPTSNWLEIINKLFDLHANWAVQRILPSIPMELIDDVIEIIKKRKQPKWLLESLPAAYRISANYSTKNAKK